MSNAELLAQWNAEKQIRRCMHQYMRLCDELGPGSDLDALMSLFAADATWERLVAMLAAPQFGKCLRATPASQATS